MPSKSTNKTSPKSLKTEILNRRTLLEKQENNERMSFLEDHFKTYFNNLKSIQDDCNKLGHDWKRLISLTSDGYVCSNCKFVKENLDT